MFTEPIVLPHADGNQSLRRINNDNYGSEYLKKNTLDEYQMKIRHSTMTDKASGQVYDRHNVEVTQVIYATSTVAEYHRKVSLTITLLPSDGDVKLADSLCDLAIATADAFLVQLNQKES